MTASTQTLYSVKRIADAARALLSQGYSFMTAEELNNALFSKGRGSDMPTIIQQFVFTDHNRRPGICRVEIYRGKRYDLVVLTELEGNTGMSVTNASERIASQVCQSYRLDPARVRWVERYLPDVSGYTERSSQDEITYTWNGTQCSSPQWRYLSEKDFQQLIDRLNDEQE